MKWKDYKADFLLRIIPLPCLVGIGYVQGHFLAGLLLALLLGIHTLIMAQPQSLAKGIGPRRPVPWLIMVLSVSGLCYATSHRFEVPTYPSEPCLRDLAQVPVTLDGIALNMTPEQIRSLRGQPTNKELQYTVMASTLDAWTTKEIIRKLLETDLPQNENKVAREAYANFATVVEEASSVNSRLDPNRFYARKYPRPEAKLQLIVVDQLPKEDGYEEFLKERESRKVGGFDLFLVCPSSQNSIVLTGHAREMWSFSGGEDDTTIAFSSKAPHPVELIFGNRLKLGTRTWLKVGEPVARMNLPGPPLKPDKERFLDYSEGDEVWVKAYSGKEVFIGVEGDRSVSLRLGL